MPCLRSPGRVHGVVLYWSHRRYYLNSFLTEDAGVVASWRGLSQRVQRQMFEFESSVENKLEVILNTVVVT
jgi:hypothetical protein